ncbi:hypothetical protein KZZ52_45375 [Dactylosporangium sp. AC04546]|uniref:effector-associated constant component EACC1 n=1 Tax=Dactylosporangium sp. AC04546 TaxID=2862460 RepID=UPI001EDCC58A|nr:hypothetical protein [Dactylosporangium sp. AC04546]WVK81148.1 hypothetical protein KZZ52_45375 [Dactylosporangium sp. AC04546]
MAGLDVITALVGSGLSVGALANAVFAWRDRRRKAPKIKVTYTKGDGSSVTLHIDGAASAETLRQVLQGLESDATATKPENGPKSAEPTST